MADITITAANVLSSGTAFIQGTAGATITAGQVLYKDTADSKYKLADADGASALIQTAAGIACNGASDGQPVNFVKLDADFTIGATVSEGVAYYLSETPGGICPRGDVSTGSAVVYIGMGLASNKLKLDIDNTGATSL